MTEQWSRWEPIEGLSSKYSIESISNTIDGFELLLADSDDEKKMIRIIFENSVYAYKSTNETFRCKLIYDLDEQYGTNFYGNWTFFKVNNSSYIKSMSEESCGISDSQPLIHFSILASDSVVDIIAVYEPIVQLIQKNN